MLWEAAGREGLVLQHLGAIVTEQIPERPGLCLRHQLLSALCLHGRSAPWRLPTSGSLCVSNFPYPSSSLAPDPMPLPALSSDLAPPGPFLLSPSPQGQQGQATGQRPRRREGAGPQRPLHGSWESWGQDLNPGPPGPRSRAISSLPSLPAALIPQGKQIP